MEQNKEDNHRVMYNAYIFERRNKMIPTIYCISNCTYNYNTVQVIMYKMRNQLLSVAKQLKVVRILYAITLLNLQYQLRL